MEISVEQTSKLERRMKVQVPAQEVDREVESRLRSFGRNAKLKGFRPGKIPFKVIKQRYGGQVRREVIGEVMQTSFAEAVRREQLQPAGGPRIEPGPLAEGQDLQYTAVFEVYPEIDLKGTDKLKIERPVADITDADVDTVIKNLREQRGEWQRVERKAAAGDRVIVDFVGRIDGEVFEGGSAQEQPIVLGAGDVLEDLDKGLIGAVADEQREVKVRFPKQYHNEDLAAKRALFELRIRHVEERVLPEMDDEFLASYGIAEGGVEALRDGVRENMRRELEQTVQKQMQQQVLDQLLEANPIELPQALVEEEIARLRADASRRMGIEDPAQAPAAELFQEQARRRVALGLIMRELLDREPVELDQVKVDERLRALTAEYQDPGQVERAFRANQQLMRNVETAVLEGQLVENLLAKARIKDKQSTFAKLMNIGN